MSAILKIQYFSLVGPLIDIPMQDPSGKQHRIQELIRKFVSQCHLEFP